MSVLRGNEHARFNNHVTFKITDLDKPDKSCICPIFSYMYIYVLSYGYIFYNMCHSDIDVVGHLRSGFSVYMLNLCATYIVRVHS